jgi:hypothetical protein
VGSFKNLIKNYEARKAEFDMNKGKLIKITGSRGLNGANGNEMHIIFLYEPRLLR